MNNEDDPILANSINRVILINKEEYILSYKHLKIESYTTQNVLNTNLDLGKFYLTKKNPNKEGNFIQYISDEKILAKETVNQHVLNNDKNLIQKIVHILEGKLNYNETYKLDDKTFKIILNMKNGVNLVMFSCQLKYNVLKDSSFVLLTCMRYFKNKSKINEAFDIEINEKNKKNDITAKKYSNLSRDIERQENEFLNNICVLLNNKKQKIKSLQREIDGEEDFILEKSDSKLKDSLNPAVEELNQSQTYSLSDLI